MQIIQKGNRPNFNCNCALKPLQVYLSGWCHCLSDGCCHCLSGGSDSDNKASLSSSETVLELPTGTELGKNYIHQPQYWRLAVRLGGPEDLRSDQCFEFGLHAKFQLPELSGNNIPGRVAMWVGSPTVIIRLSSIELNLTVTVIVTVTEIDNIFIKV